MSNHPHVIPPVVSEPGQEKAQNASTTLEHLAWLDIYSEPSSSRKTHIICTIGPSSRSVEVLLDLMKAGMSVVRMNFSHGTHEYHGGTVKLAREAAALFGAPIGIALDTKGPEIRSGLLEAFAQNPKAEIELKAGNSLTLTMDEAYFDKCNENIVYCDYKNMWKVVKPGNKIYMDDGLIGLLVEETGENFVKTKIINSGLLGSKKGMNIPGVDVDLPALSQKDKEDLIFGLEQGVDMIFASFIRSRQDVMDIRAVLGDKGSHIKIISKIENHQGIRHFDEILEESDGIMVARGDLGIEIPTEKVFLAQKMMIARCNLAGKPVICATQMLESMVHAPRPTRAESSDVANAVIDGADCVMLSGETAKGDYPVETVKIMANICREAEGAIFYRHFREELRTLTKRPTSTTETCAVAAVDASMANDAKAIICLTISGRTARLMSKWRPKCPIISVTRNASVARQNQLLRGVVPVIYPKEKLPEETWAQDVDNRFFFAMEQGKAAGILESGDKVIGVHGWQSGPGHTNTVRILLVQ